MFKPPDQPMTALRWILGSVALATTACGASRTAPTPVLGEVDQAPDRGSCPQPHRPPDAIHSAGMDTVVVQFVLDTTGHAARGTMRVVRSTDPHLNPAATIVAWGCHYAPARKGGQAVPVIIQQPVFF